MNEVTFKKVDQSTYLIRIRQDMDSEISLSLSPNHIQQSPTPVLIEEEPNKVFPLADRCTYFDRNGMIYGTKA